MPQILFEPAAGRRNRGRVIAIAIALLAILLLARWISELAVEWAWWTELGQVDTWIGLFTYAYAPVTGATLIAWGALWMTRRGALRFAGGSRRRRLSESVWILALLLLAWLIASATLENWTVVRYFGSRALVPPPGSFHDPIFGKPLTFYLFDLPFYSALRSYLLGLAIACALLFWIAARARQLGEKFHDIRSTRELDFSVFRLSGGLESSFLRTVMVIVLLALACRYFLGRYEMASSDHVFMVGIDWVDDHVTLPLQWLLIGASLLAAVLVWMRRWRWAVALLLVLPVTWILPKLVSALYAKPNEISLEAPYINAHIHATRSAYGIESRVKEVEYPTEPTSAVQSLNVAQNRSLLDNVRLWDWRAFHDTVTQSQALRPYYVFHDTDLDRYTIDGQYRQTLLTPRELDISQVRNAGWVNPHFIYTHGYGLALAEVSHITPEGLPVFLVQNMPPEVRTPSLKITQPDLYFSEVTHEPVFVRTAQMEFDYPSGNDNAKTRYAGSGGFSVSSLFMRMAAAIDYGDPNILLTNYLTGESRMMIHRNITDRVSTLAPFLDWDADPYLVITPEGRLVWILDGYTASNAHPFAREVEFREGESINYIRNSVKATVDAFDGTVHFYIFDAADPLIQAYRTLFPRLFEPASAMPQALRQHARYPEALFQVQAGIYRTFHMVNAQAFYNREDIWEIARSTRGQDQAPEPIRPTYVVATLPGEASPEFMLMTSFTPMSKENLIGVMLARCDGEHLGDVRVLELSKQELTLGPMQVNARINQDQNISKDLTLWNQQGSQALRGQMLVLPVAHTFLYVEPIYIQATEARMPQLRKIVLAIGNRLIYTDTYEEALAQLGAAEAGTSTVETEPAPSQAVAPAPPSQPDSNSANARIARIRENLRRYRELTSQGKLGEAGKELEAIDNELR